jgi:hypothetical protein
MRISELANVSEHTTIMSCGSVDTPIIDCFRTNLNKAGERFGNSLRCHDKAGPRDLTYVL